MTRKSALWLLLTFSVFYIALTRGHFVGTDEIAMYQTTRSLWERGNFAITHINNTFEGRNAEWYTQYSPGQSIAAVPLYAIGKGTKAILNRTGNTRMVAALAGPTIGKEPNKWGGDVELFFVNLFNCFVTAAACALFFVFSCELGATKQFSLVATLLLGLTSYVAPFSAGFLQHSSEAFFLLLISFCLFRYSQSGERKYLTGAGIAAGLMLLFRVQSVISFPAFALYAWLIARRRGESVLRGASSIISPIIVAVLLHASVNYWKFGNLAGRYNNEGFHTPLLRGLNGFLFSPGDSIFIFAPLLLLVPWTLRAFSKQHREETILILALSVSYLVFYAKYTAWHGLWSAFGPRYLMPVVPLLLLPLGKWIQSMGPRAFMAIVPLGIIGLWVQLVHFATNFAFVYNHEKWPAVTPAFDFLFVPAMAPISAASRAFIAHDFRVDMWLVNIYRLEGGAVVFAYVSAILMILAVCTWRFVTFYRREN